MVGKRSKRVEIRRVKMKPKYLVSLLVLLVTLLAAIGCGPAKLAIPPDAIDEIYAMSEDEAIREYVEVIEVQDRKDYCYIMVYIKFVPEEVTNLEDAYVQGELFTRTFVEAAVKILNRYDINEDISVWAQLPLEEGGVTMLGHAKYDVKTDTFHDFERYKP
ncbi:hypothetical protein ES703_42534 [subsurface metagenome]